MVAKGEYSLLGSAENHAHEWFVMCVQLRFRLTHTDDSGHAQNQLGVLAAANVDRQCSAVDRWMCAAAESAESTGRRGRWRRVVFVATTRRTVGESELGERFYY